MQLYKYDSHFPDRCFYDDSYSYLSIRYFWWLSFPYHFLCFDVELIPEPASEEPLFMPRHDVRTPSPSPPPSAPVSPETPEFSLQEPSPPPQPQEPPKVGRHQRTVQSAKLSTVLQCCNG